MVGAMGAGKFFGEMALVQQSAGRAADCLAAQKTRVRAAFCACCMHGAQSLRAQGLCRLLWPAPMRPAHACMQVMAATTATGWTAGWWACCRCFIWTLRAQAVRVRLPQVLTLGRDAFERLMGPAESILAEQVALYERTNRGMSFSGVARHPRRSYL